jgi:hypothetical protein
MKNKYLIIVLLLGLAGMFTIQSCTKDESPTPVIYKAAVPMNPTPAEGAVVPLDGTSYVLKWEGTTTTSWDVYFGPAGGELAKVKTGLTGNTFTVTVAEGGEYEWYVQTKDANGIVSSNITGPARDPWYFYINTAPTAPELTKPLDGATNVVPTTALTWTSGDAEGDAIKYDVFFGKTTTPALVATGLTDQTYSPTMADTTTYYWKVIATDSHGASSTSVVHSFKTGLTPPNYAVFVGTANEVSPSISATAHTVSVQRLGLSNEISLYLPLADAMVGAGWGTVYSGTHPIIITYDPVTYVVTGAKQAWCDSFIDPTEMGPMALTVKSGTINAFKKTIKITWIVSGNAYWGADYTLKETTYTMK